MRLGDQDSEVILFMCNITFVDNGALLTVTISNMGSMVQTVTSYDQ